MDNSVMECSICLSVPVFPVILKCDHIFCYLCIKGATSLVRKCPLCRKKIQKSFLSRPKFVRKRINMDRPSVAFDSYQWFYEGKKQTGWWCYDDQSCQVLEQAFTSGLKTCQLTIAGHQYNVDFVTNVQCRCDDNSKQRKIKRELLSNVDNAKGVAGVSKKCVNGIFGAFAEQSTKT